MTLRKEIQIDSEEEGGYGLGVKCMYGGRICREDMGRRFLVNIGAIKMAS